ncbi:uncharacterized protein METZ01_LOCUS258156 [marine metagenome]|uniref:Uncharacterized protein n=1 Tax=marine metagenome TaxID=408172 RepID=A0A382J1L7_9ZZZZ
MATGPISWADAVLLGKTTVNANANPSVSRRSKVRSLRRWGLGPPAVDLIMLSLL